MNHSLYAIYKYHRIKGTVVKAFCTALRILHLHALAYFSFLGLYVEDFLRLKYTTVT